MMIGIVHPDCSQILVYKAVILDFGTYLSHFQLLYWVGISLAKFQKLPILTGMNASRYYHGNEACVWHCVW